VNSQVGAGGACEIATSVCNAAVKGGGRRNLVNCFHGRGDALHVHAGGTGGNQREQSGGPFRGLKLQFTPAGNDCGARPKTVAEPLSCSQRIIRGLSVDVQRLSSVRITSDCSSRFIVGLGCIADYPDHGTK